MRSCAPLHRWIPGVAVQIGRKGEGSIPKYGVHMGKKYAMHGDRNRKVDAETGPGMTGGESRMLALPRYARGYIYSVEC